MLIESVTVGVSDVVPLSETDSPEAERSGEDDTLHELDGVEDTEPNSYEIDAELLELRLGVVLNENCWLPEADKDRNNGDSVRELDCSLEGV